MSFNIVEMAELKTAIVPLNAKTYPTWKVQCRMALMKDSLWGITSGTETLASDASADNRKKFEARRDRALAIIVLAVDPSLLYLIGNPDDPADVWKKLEEQFQSKQITVTKEAVLTQARRRRVCPRAH